MIVGTNRITGFGRGDGRRQTLLAAALTIGGLTVALVLGLLSDGFYQDDDVCHYLFARDAWTSIDCLLHQWARAGYNLPTTIVAHFFGVEGCRVFSALQTAGVAWLAFLIARRIAAGMGGQSWWAALAPAFVWAQPLTMTLALTTLTETPAALYLALGMWLYLRGNRVWACAAFSALFVTRYETMGLAPIIAGAVLFDAFKAGGWKFRKALKCPWLWGCAAAMVWGPALYAGAAYLAEVSPDASPLAMFSRSYSPEYGSGSPGHFLSVWPEAAGLGVLACAVTGAVWLHRRAWLATALTAGLVALHSWLFWRGSFATGGYARFLVPLSAPVAVLAAAGFYGAWRATNRYVVAILPAVAAGWLTLVILRWWMFLPMVFRPSAGRFALMLAAPLVLAALLALLLHRVVVRWVGRLAALAAVVFAAGQIASQVHPMTLVCDKNHYVVHRAVRAIEQSEYRDRPGITQHVLVRFLRRNTTALYGNSHALAMWRKAQPGTLFFWENKYCYKPHEMESTELLWQEMWRLGRQVHKSEQMSAVAVVFERRGDTSSRPSTEVATTGPAGP